jgi:surface antigen
MRPVQCKARLPGLLVALGLALPGGGCSFAVPLVSSEASVAEPASTGTIAKRPEPVLSPELGPEDWRRASAALAVALDPQGNGKPVKWENPETELHGAINPTAPPFVQNDEICRAFHATVAGPSFLKDLRGTACRPSGGAWALKQVGPKPAPGRKA